MCILIFNPFKNPHLTPLPLAPSHIRSLHKENEFMKFHLDADVILGGFWCLKILLEHEKLRWQQWRGGSLLDEKLKQECFKVRYTFMLPNMYLHLHVLNMFIFSEY